jgi:hypothetical protein
VDWIFVFSCAAHNLLPPATAAQPASPATTAASVRSGDVWVGGSRQFKNFDEYLVPAHKFAALKKPDELPLAIDSNCEHYLRTRLDALHVQAKLVDELAAANDLPDAILTDSGFDLRSTHPCRKPRRT